VIFWLLRQAVRAVTSTVAARVVWLVDDLAVQRRCACGHLHEAHRHLRPGSDCGACGWSICPAYRYRPFTPRRT